MALGWFAKYNQQMIGCPACGSPQCHGQCQQNSFAQLHQQQIDMMQKMMGVGGLPAGLLQEEKPKQREPLPQEEIFCATGGLVGWRDWRVPCFGDKLYSFIGAVWLPCEPHRATCKKGSPEDCLGEACTCGIYSWKDRKNLKANRDARNVVTGEMWMWGKVIEHTLGYRAEYAYPKAFLDNGPDARRVARIYRVPLLKDAK